MSIDSVLDVVVEGYDIDGVLTEEENREKFLKSAETKKVIPIIITGRNDKELGEFLQKHPEIEEKSRAEFNGSIKIQRLREAKEKWPLADRHIYYGSWIRDRIIAKIAGWEFKQL